MIYNNMIKYLCTSPSANDLTHVTNVHDKASSHASDKGSKDGIIQYTPTPTDTHPQTQIIHIIFIRTRTR